MKTITKTLLVADDTSEYRRSLRSVLEIEDYQVEEAASPQEAKEKLVSSTIDLALVDLRLTKDADADDISGLEVAKFASERSVPCVIVTAYASVEAARLALRSRGIEPPLALDLIPKANGPHAILDAIRIALSRSESEMPDRDLFMDLDRRLVWHSGVPVDLSRQQYQLLSHLWLQRGAVCSPEELLKVVYDEDVAANQATTDKRLERLVARLREKIEKDPSHPQHLVNVPGRGYRLETEG